MIAEAERSQLSIRSLYFIARTLVLSFGLVAIVLVIDVWRGSVLGFPEDPGPLIRESVGAQIIVFALGLSCVVPYRLAITSWLYGVRISLQSLGSAALIFTVAGWLVVGTQWLPVKWLLPLGAYLVCVAVALPVTLLYRRRHRSEW